MLVLSRRLNEKLLIPGIRTAIQVLSIQGAQVRLGVDAPAEVAVFREEIYHGDDEPRHQLSGMAVSLDRLRRGVRGKLAPDARAELVKLARAVKTLLDDDARRPSEAAHCTR